MTEADFAARSKAAFALRFPDLAAAIDNETSRSSVVFDGERAVDISIGERRIYESDARSLSLEQVDAFMAKPLRLVMERPDDAGLISPICVSLLAGLETVLREGNVSEIAREPQEPSTFLVILGVGLGHHLVELVRRTGARWVIIAEPFIEFIDHSHAAVDWSELFDLVDRRDGEIHFVRDLEPSQMVTSIMRRMAEHGVAYIDGTWVFTHYPLWAFAEARKRLHGAAEFAFVNRGFFEDEIVMMTNAVTNFTARPFFLINAERRLHRPEMVAIVGAGPSLDEALEKLHEIRDRVVLFSAGTALRPLLRNGLVPDFHCELENGPQVVEVLAEAGKHGDLSRISLIASLTVDPRVPDFFGERFLFFRDTVSSTRILRARFRPIYGSAPTCVNTALAAAAALGFTNFLLFGTDCGVRQGRDDHAEGTIYQDVWQHKPDLAKTYPLEVEGNFGGIAMTNWIYDGCRRMLAETISLFRLSAVNCSDGALIPGAIPKVPESVELAGAPVDRAALLAHIKRSTTPCTPDAALAEIDFLGLSEHNRALYRAVRDVIAAFDPAQPDFAGAFAALAGFIEKAGASFGYLDAIPDGTLWALPRIAMFYGTRLRDDALRRRLFAAFLEKLRGTVDDMEQRTEAMFLDLERRRCAEERRAPRALAL